MNRRDLLRNVGTLTGNLLHEKGYISYPDLFIGLGYLDPKDYESWRFRRIPYLEKAIRVNLSRISFIMKAVRRNSLNGKLKPRRTGYVSWGKGRKVHLRFSRSGTPAIEELWSTHFVSNRILSATRRNAGEAGSTVADSAGPGGDEESEGCSALESWNASPPDGCPPGEEIR